ncbi:hypothetical protein NBRC110019_12480 [Neptunitalea chrysea]|uniref:DUF5777 domain-containing protein n=2 Tax=Neptunitalea chrysea TaxID=1647581 RepID=A0A9W6B449_9FLAO|nr:hypothetical protein NBRC110019_12480 [Neptunitalea chrysea]
MFLFVGLFSYAQDDLLDELDEEVVDEGTVSSTFKALQIVTLQSTKIAAPGDFYFVVSHRFGTVKNGFSEFFGLDNATTKLGGIYGVTDWMSVGLSRHTLLKTYELSIKYRLVNQSDNFPFTIVGYHSMGANSYIDKDDYENLAFTDRLAYVNQLLISRKISAALSLELAPSYVQKNLYNKDLENDKQFVLAAGSRYKLSNRVSLNLEYGYNFNQPEFYSQPLSLGVDIETGGHVFQLLFTNSQAMTDSGYLTNATGDWGQGDFFFGFNLYRVF